MILVISLFLAAGLALVVVGVLQAKRPTTDIESYMNFLDGDQPADAFAESLEVPFVARVLRPVAGAVLGSVGRFTPASRREQVRHQLVIAGLDTRVRAEDFMAMQILAGIGGVVLGLLYLAVGQASSTTRLGVMLLVSAAGILGPQAWLSRKMEARKRAIFMDLPDVLDLMAISVEAGVGFEAALDIVCDNFHSPLADEFARTLREMQLGLARHDALQSLKRRTEVPELSNFILALTQADALGMPIGRVLHTQAAEMRMRRRMYAREKAGAMPVKILFPLALFIFPAILVIIVGPAWGGISKAFGK